MKAKIGFQVWASGETGSLRILDRTSEFFSEYFGKGGKRGKREEIYHYQLKTNQDIYKGL